MAQTGGNRDGGTLVEEEMGLAILDMQFHTGKVSIVCFCSSKIIIEKEIVFCVCVIWLLKGPIYACVFCKNYLQGMLSNVFVM